MEKLYLVRLIVVIKDVNATIIFWQMITAPLKTFKLLLNWKTASYAIVLTSYML